MKRWARLAVLVVVLWMLLMAAYAGMVVEIK